MSVTGVDVAAAERVLREVLTGLYVHVACGGVRGRVDSAHASSGESVNLGRWQSCTCETHPERWPDVDVSSEVDLCVLCARGTAGGTSRWAWVVCGTCRTVEQAAAHWQPLKGGGAGLRPAPCARESPPIRLVGARAPRTSTGAVGYTVGYRQRLQGSTSRANRPLNWSYVVGRASHNANRQPLLRGPMISVA